MSIETELKLQISPEKIVDFQQHPLLQTAKQGLTEKWLHNTYFDTPAHDLLAAGAGLRIRLIEDRRLQTLKTGGQTQNGLHQRHEWEVEVSSDTPDLKLLPKFMRIKGLSRKSLQQQLIPVFITEFKRSTWDLQWDNDTLIEIALDQGQIRTEKNEQLTLISEIELELKSGSPSALYQVALALQMDIALTLENRSKAERGYALHHPPEIVAHKAGQVALMPEDNAETAFMTICWHCLNQLQANEAAILQHNDPEGIHQMRVALRRLRSAFTLFRDLIPKSTQAVFYEDLKWITEQLGIARDWDIFYLTLAEMATQLIAIDSDYDLSPLKQTVIDLQQTAYHHVHSVLMGQRYHRLLLQLGYWLTERVWRLHLNAEQLLLLTQPAIEFANRTLHKRYQKLQKKGEKLSILSANERHQVRIEVKKLAYGSRFFAALYPSKVTHQYSQKLSQMQDVLGVLNDGYVADQLCQKAQILPDSYLHALLKGWYLHQYALQQQQLDADWQALLTQKIFWQKPNP
ncbi:CYTH and CHAD domain-containing protein [Thioflexithrix psekupsensis]|uniref:Inorganic triphosphatase n=1 Tax=Thioflexithrix psekupsensis TaxID=1570016 RepID=A0A251XBR6_9GAMM|nr:CYTH and CHAD domain-containing protein [Thioflexithrix psekupsensis]OUD15496.1 hypothetical protein TPSD3_02955 [Thioflexithrix psekupsensis]